MSSPIRWSVGEKVRAQYVGRNGRVVERAGTIEDLYLTPVEQLADVVHVDGTSRLYPLVDLVPWYRGG